VRIGASGYFSNTVGLSPDWSMLYIDYIAQRTGSSLDLQVEDGPLAIGEQFEVDNVSIRIVTSPPPSSAGMPLESSVTSPLALASAPEPIDLASGAPFWRVLIGADAGAAEAGPRFTRFALRYRDREIAAAEAVVLAAGPARTEVRFDREDLGRLFAGLDPGRQPATVTFRGETLGGAARSADLAVEVVGAPTPLRPAVTPNPIQGRGVIAFVTSRSGPLRAEVFDASGRRVRRLAWEPRSAAGWHDLELDGRDDGGASLPAGVYFYRVESVDGIATGRFTLLR
jgi:hypothetical protein